MDLKEMRCPDPWMEAAEAAPSGQPFANLNALQQTQKQEDASVLDYGIRTEPRSPEFNQFSGSYDPFNSQTEASHREDDQINELWEPRSTLSNLAFLEQKIHQLQDLVHLIGSRRVQALGRPNGVVAQHQQLINADLTSIIVQLISAAGSLLPSMKNTDPSDGLLNPFFGNSDGGVQLQNGRDQLTGDLKGNAAEELESKDEDDVEGENLPPGSYEILQIEREEILAPHTHFCVICGKGFKRDANLRMHMRGHGDEYKTPAALAKPTKESGSEPLLIKRYSCPYAGCKRNKDHAKFQPLKTILCVKNHYKRTHCDKSYTCSRCNSKKFSVLADLKTHEKHCGRDKWLCSCGTTFSRKDKLFGHIALFQGHAPAVTLDEAKGAGGPSEHGESDDAMNTVPNMGLNFNEAAGCLSPLNFDTCNFGGFHEFPRPPFDDSENSFSFLNDGSFSYASNGLQ